MFQKWNCKRFFFLFSEFLFYFREVAADRVVMLMNRVTYWVSDNWWIWQFHLFLNFNKISLWALGAFEVLNFIEKPSKHLKFFESNLDVSFVLSGGPPSNGIVNDDVELCIIILWSHLDLTHIARCHISHTIWTRDFTFQSMANHLNIPNMDKINNLYDNLILVVEF